jgi:hypothetical protein
MNLTIINHFNPIDWLCSCEKEVGPDFISLWLICSRKGVVFDFIFRDLQSHSFSAGFFASPKWLFSKIDVKRFSIQESISAFRGRDSQLIRCAFWWSEIWIDDCSQNFVLSNLSCACAKPWAILTRLQFPPSEGYPRRLPSIRFGSEWRRSGDELSLFCHKFGFGEVAKSFLN